MRHMMEGKQTEGHHAASFSAVHISTVRAGAKADGKGERGQGKHIFKQFEVLWCGSSYREHCKTLNDSTKKY